MLTYLKNSHFFSNICAELISELRNASESRNNDPILEGLGSKTSRKITIFQKSCRKVRKTTSQRNCDQRKHPRARHVTGGKAANPSGTVIPINIEKTVLKG